MDTWIISSLLLLLTTQHARGGVGGSPTKCQYQQVRGMNGADCANLRLNKLPTDLKSSTEVLIASDNKLSELNADTFTRVPNIRLLYLEDNRIYIIEPKAFDPLTSLESLDLSLNSLKSIPTSVLNIVSLRRLNLNGNKLLEIDFYLEKITKPIKAPLEYLSLADCGLKSIPDFGLLPNLISYNISENSLEGISEMDFARTCSLGTTDLRNSVQTVKQCDLKRTYDWLDTHGVNISLSSDDFIHKDFSQCRNESLAAESAQATYKRCKATHTTQRLISIKQNKWVTIAGSLGGFLVGFILLLYLLHLVNVRQIRKASKKANKRNKELAASKLIVDVS